MSGLAGHPGLRPGNVTWIVSGRGHAWRDCQGTADEPGGGPERAGAVAERTADRAAQLAFKQETHQPPVGELGLGQGQPDAQQRVLAEPSRLTVRGSDGKWNPLEATGTSNGEARRRAGPAPRPAGARRGQRADPPRPA